MSLRPRVTRRAPNSTQGLAHNPCRLRSEGLRVTRCRAMAASRAPRRSRTTRTVQNGLGGSRADERPRQPIPKTGNPLTVSGDRFMDAIDLPPGLPPHDAAPLMPVPHTVVAEWPAGTFIENEDRKRNPWHVEAQQPAWPVSQARRVPKRGADVVHRRAGPLQEPSAGLRQRDVPSCSGQERDASPLLQHPHGLAYGGRGYPEIPRGRRERTSLGDFQKSDQPVEVTPLHFVDLLTSPFRLSPSSGDQGGTSFSSSGQRTVTQARRSSDDQH